MADERFQPESQSSGAVRSAFGGLPAPSLAALASPRTLFRGALFGAVVGGLAGAVAGAASSWLLGFYEHLSAGIVIGAMLGPPGGAVIGFLERYVRGELARPDIAVLVCGSIGAIPGALMLLQGFGAVRGVFSGGLLLGAISLGPMCGILLGGIFDRAFEAALRRSWRSGVVFSLIGLTACAGLLWRIDAMAYGPDPDEVSRLARSTILKTWRAGPGGKRVRVHDLTLQRRGRHGYVGFVEIVADDKRERLTLSVTVDPRGEITLDAVPSDE